jgi:hypothetical protein
MEEEMLAKVEREKMEGAIRRRQKYLEEQKRKIQESIIEQALIESQAALNQEREIKVRARRQIVEQQKANNKLVMTQAYD